MFFFSGHCFVFFFAIFQGEDRRLSKSTSLGLI